MWCRVILLFFVLIIAIVFPSEAAVPLEEAVANETFFGKIVLDMEEAFEKFVDLAMNIEDSTDPPSSLLIHGNSMTEQAILVAEISAMPATIMREKGIVTPWKCLLVAGAAMGPISGMLKRLTIVAAESTATALQYKDDLEIMTPTISARVHAHKGKFEACAKTCTGSMSCIRSMFCMTWGGLVLLFDLPIGLFQKYRYLSTLSSQITLLNNFKSTVQSNLENDSEYADGKRKINEKIAELEKCMAE